MWLPDFSIILQTFFSSFGEAAAEGDASLVAAPELSPGAAAIAGTAAALRRTVAVNVRTCVRIVSLPENPMPSFTPNLIVDAIARQVGWQKSRALLSKYFCRTAFLGRDSDLAGRRVLPLPCTQNKIYVEEGDSGRAIGSAAKLRAGSGGFALPASLKGQHHVEETDGTGSDNGLGGSGRSGDLRRVAKRRLDGAPDGDRRLRSSPQSRVRLLVPHRDCRRNLPASPQPLG
jgi:hypothetical protein